MLEDNDNIANFSRKTAGGNCDLVSGLENSAGISKSEVRWQMVTGKVSDDADLADLI